MMKTEEHDEHMRKRMHELMEHYDRKGMHEKLKMHDSHMAHMNTGNHKFTVMPAKKIDELK